MRRAALFLLCKLLPAQPILKLIVLAALTLVQNMYMRITTSLRPMLRHSRYAVIVRHKLNELIFQRGVGAIVIGVRTIVIADEINQAARQP